MAASMLPNFIVIKSYSHADEGYAYYKSDNSVVLGEDDVLSTAVKIAVEPATSDSRYVHLRFVYCNGYWGKNAGDAFINSASKQPIEDTTDPACTLFEPVMVAGENQTLYFVHVQSGKRVLRNDNLAFYVEAESDTNTYGYLTYVDWESLVKMPAHVAFKGDNEKYLELHGFDAAVLLQFASSDPNEKVSGHRVTQMKDGRVQITSDSYGMWWSGAWIGWGSDTWVYGDWSNNWDSESAIFTPVKIDDTTIALRSNGPYSGNNFCTRFSAGARTDCLSPSAPTITTTARLVVQELVLTRTIYEAVYDMTSARIYNQTPFVAGTTVLTNYSDEEASMEVDITYTNEISYTFSRSVSLTAGVTTSFEVGVPLIAETDIEISFNINTTLDWDTTTTTTTSVTASGSVPVPARSSATIQYVGTTGTCDVPYSYKQKDVSAVDGSIVYSSQTDGIYTGVNSYNFNFVITSTTPLPAAA